MRPSTQFMRGNKSEGAAVYRPLPPRCALPRANRAGEAPRGSDGRRLLALRRYGQRDRCRRPPRPGFRRSPGPPRSNLYEAVRERIAAEQARGRQVVIAAVSGVPATGWSMYSATMGSPAARRWPIGPRPPHCRPRRRLRGIGPGEWLRCRGSGRRHQQDILGDRMVRAATRSRRAQISSPKRQVRRPAISSPTSTMASAATRVFRPSMRSARRMTVSRSSMTAENSFLPVENIELLTRYGADESTAQLDRLGGAGWQHARRA